MKRIFFLLFSLLLVCCISACQKGGKGVTPTQSSLIIGKWILQQQKMVMYVNDIKQTDTSLMSSLNNVGHTQFNSDGTFSSASYSINATGNGSLGTGAINMVTRDSTYGTYSIANSALTLQAPLSGFSIPSSSFGTTTEIPVFKLISQSAQITLLTSSKLTIHWENVYSETTSVDSKTYKNEFDYYYSK